MSMQTPFVVAAALMAVTSVGCDSGATSALLPDGGAGGSGGYWLALAADFASGGTCGDEPAGAVGAAGCDIYRARLDATTWQPLSIERLTTDPAPEVFPSITADGARVYFHAMASATARSLVEVDAASKARTTVAADAQYAEVLPDGKRLLFSDVAAGTVLTLGTLDSSGVMVTARAAVGSLMPAQDANASADGTHAVFHVPGSGTAHGVYVVDLSAPSPALLTQSAGVGHCAISPSGTRVICDNAQGKGLSQWTLSGTTATGGTLVVADPTALAAADADYASCGTTSVDFPSFCDESHLAVSVSCVSLPAGIRFSKVYLADLTTTPASLQPLGASLAARFGGPGKTSWTPDCRAAR